MLALPRTVFVGFVDFGRIGLGTSGDFETTLEDAAEKVLNCHGDVSSARILRIDFDARTGLPETVSDVTDQAQRYLPDAIAAE